MGTQKRLRRTAPAGPPSPHAASPGSWEESLLPAVTRQPRQPDTLCPRRLCRAGCVEISCSPRRRCPPPASATGCNVLASDEGTPHGLGTHLPAAGAPPGRGQHIPQPEGRPSPAGQQPPGRPAEPARARRARTRPGRLLLGSLHRPLGSESQTYQVGLGTAAQAHPGSPPSTYGVAEGPGMSGLSRSEPRLNQLLGTCVTANRWSGGHGAGLPGHRAGRGWARVSSVHPTHSSSRPHHPASSGTRGVLGSRPDLLVHL